MSSGWELVDADDDDDDDHADDDKVAADDGFCPSSCRTFMGLGGAMRVVKSQSQMAVLGFSQYPSQQVF